MLFARAELRAGDNQSKQGFLAKLGSYLAIAFKTHPTGTCRGCGGKIETDTVECQACWDDRVI